MMQKIVSIYDVRLNQDLNIKEFRKMTDEWLDLFFVCGLIGYIARKQKIRELIL